MIGNAKYNPLRPAEERFWSRVEKTADCWLWTGTKNNGYAAMNINGRTVSARNFSWRLHRGPITDGRLFDRCGCKACVNPNHLYLAKRKKRR